MWQLARLQYWDGASFYRTLYKGPDNNFVVQFGYRGVPDVDACWDAHMTSNATWSVHAPGNVRGTVSFSMDAVGQTHVNPNCTSPAYCAQGFSTNIFVNCECVLEGRGLEGRDLAAIDARSRLTQRCRAGSAPAALPR